MSGTDDGIALPIAQTGFARDNGRTLGKCRFYWGSGRDRRSCQRDCYSVFRAVGDCATGPPRVAFVLPDHLVDALMAQAEAPFVSQPAAASARATSASGTASLRSCAAIARRQLAGLTPYRLSGLRLRLRLLEPIAALPPIAAYLPAHRALTDAQNDGDAFFAGPALAQRINLAAILIRNPSVLAHRQTPCNLKRLPLCRLTQFYALGS